jgi:hypothetical protein
MGGNRRGANVSIRLGWTTMPADDYLSSNNLSGATQPGRGLGAAFAYDPSRTGVPADAAEAGLGTGSDLSISHDI